VQAGVSRGRRAVDVEVPVVATLGEHGIDGKVRHPVERLPSGCVVQGERDFELAVRILMQACRHGFDLELVVVGHIELTAALVAFHEHGRDVGRQRGADDRHQRKAEGGDRRQQEKRSLGPPVDCVV
jgi:hypothetical protein